MPSNHFTLSFGLSSPEIGTISESVFMEQKENKKDWLVSKFTGEQSRLVSRQVADCWWYFVSRFKDIFTAKLFFQDNFLKMHININNDNNSIKKSSKIRGGS